MPHAKSGIGVGVRSLVSLTNFRLASVKSHCAVNSEQLTIAPFKHCDDVIDIPLHEVTR